MRPVLVRAAELAVALPLALPLALALVDLPPAARCVGQALLDGWAGTPEQLAEVAMSVLEDPTVTTGVKVLPQAALDRP